LSEWEVLLSFVIGKTTANVGADGMAFWYTKSRGSIGMTLLLILPHTKGPVFGNQDNWDGIAIIFDSFDNEGNVCTNNSSDQKGDNPSVYVMKNDGTLSFSHNNDGKPDILDQCNFNYRTSSYDGQHLQPTHVKIRYQNGY
jgi:mannose-binding lectin 1